MQVVIILPSIQYHQLPTSPVWLRSRGRCSISFKLIQCSTNKIWNARYKLSILSYTRVQHRKGLLSLRTELEDYTYSAHKEAHLCSHKYGSLCRYGIWRVQTILLNFRPRFSLVVQQGVVRPLIFYCSGPCMNGNCEFILSSTKGIENWHFFFYSVAWSIGILFRLTLNKA